MIDQADISLDDRDRELWRHKPKAALERVCAEFRCTRQQARVAFELDALGWTTDDLEPFALLKRVLGMQDVVDNLRFRLDVLENKDEG